MPLPKLPLSGLPLSTPRLRRAAVAPAAALALLFAGAAGCDELLGPPPSPPAPPDPTAEKPAPRFGCTGLRRQTRATPPPVTLDELRAAVGTSAASDPTRALLEKLGQAREGPDDAQPSLSKMEYEKYNMTVFTHREDVDITVRTIEFLGGNLSAVFSGPLPEGLSFDMNVEDTFRALGLPDEKALRTFAWSRHHYRERGLGVKFDENGCLCAVALIERIPARTVRIEDLSVAPKKADSGQDGIAIRFSRAVGPVPQPGAAMRILAELADEAGKPVHGLDDDGDDTGPLRGVLSDYAADELSRALHIPYASIALAPGPHKLKATLRAQAAIDGAVADLTATGTTSFDLSIDMPRLVKASIGVQSVEVEPGVYDGDVADTGFSRPDLRWEISREIAVAGQAHIAFYRSPSRADSFTAKWTALSAPFVASPNDSILVCIDDEDVLFDDTIGCFSETLDEIANDAKSKTSLQKGKIVSLVWAAPRLLPLKPK